MTFDIDACKRILVVSPHLDDGVLSVGGIVERIAANGADVVVATVFAADTPERAVSPFAEELHNVWNLGPNPYQHRRREDICAVAMLGARVLHGPLLDALYRAGQCGEPLYPTRQAIFAPPSERDNVGEAMVDLLQGWIADLAPDLVLAPLGVGRHVDHVITTNALHSLAASRPLTVALYEDMPYSTGLFPASAPDSVQAALARTQWKVSGSQAIRVRLPGKLAAIAAYASQIADIFPNGLQFGSVLDDYMRGAGSDGGYAERLWHAAR